MVRGKKERGGGERGGFVIHRDCCIFYACCGLVILFTVIVANVAKTSSFCQQSVQQAVAKGLSKPFTEYQYHYPNYGLVHGISRRDHGY